MTTTPPITQALIEPPAPLHGSRYDQDLTSFRRSTRSTKRRTDRTPSPAAENAELLASPRSVNLRRSVRTASSSQNTFSPPSSNPSSPQTMKSNKQTHLLGEGKIQGSSRGMLPTPAKTPRRKEAKALPPAARVLFPSRPATVEEAMPTPRKRAKRTLAYSLESFEDPSNGPEIEIFTDSKDKLPEIDKAVDNPFYVQPGKRGKTTKRKENVSAHDGVQDVLERDEGMVYVFRGKKIYRKFEHVDDSEFPHGIDEAAEGLDLDSLATPRHFTRSSVKPRLLFPNATHQEQKGTTSDEEAPTDIEASSSDLEVETPMKAAKHMPATPPDTNRAKRTIKKSGLNSSPAADHSDTSSTAGKTKKPSPFMSWQRTKAGQSSGKGRKRSGEEMQREEETKRIRN